MKPILICKITYTLILQKLICFENLKTRKILQLRIFLQLRFYVKWIFSNFDTFSWGTNSLFRFSCCCCKHDRYFGAVDDNKNLDIGLYIRNRRLAIRRLKDARTIPQDFPSWPDNVVLPYRPWDNENQVPIYWIEEK